VRWVCAEDEAQVQAALRSLPAETYWQSTDLIFEIHNGPLVLFDSACLGTAIDTFLTIEIPPGRYAVQTLYYDPSEEMSMILHRLVA